MNAKIVLGHTHDDVLENIWTNFAKSQHIFNLPKMRTVSTDTMEIVRRVINVELWRPFLNTEKDVIIKFAKKYGIAYLLNTTPEWSNRGKFRNEFLPAIHRQYGTAADMNVEFVANTLREYEPIVEKVANDMWETQTNISTTQNIVSPLLLNEVEPETYLGRVLVLDEDTTSYGVHLWQHYFKTLNREMFGYTDVPSRNTVEFFLDRIRYLSNAGKSASIQMNSNLYVYFKYSTKNGCMVYFLDRKAVCKVLNVSKYDLASKHFSKLFPKKVPNNQNRRKSIDL